ncbi:hypothetical protein OSB04_027947 [Centaurea solstitialis]|uniref:HVA22-like protein n=1 Tax=Centaurea solstitialis TaxID=347529 RepID=A0AA38ST31_9ASTR|nr:hypothetical protein OSB04_027947 [Centaurea solstitialis]
MLGELITSSLVLVLGYAYPAIECFKTIEKRDVGNAELRFWCQYWVIVAILTVFERVGDVFISWVPMYGELKLALIIYLWSPKTKGTGFVYDTLLRPFIVRHETDIEKSLKQFRDRAWDVAIYYWQNSTELGQTKIFEIFNYLISKPSSSSSKQSSHHQNHQKPQMNPTPNSSGPEYGDDRWAPTAPPAPFAGHNQAYPPLSPDRHGSSSANKEPLKRPEKAIEELGYKTEASVRKSVPYAVEDGGPIGVRRRGHGSQVRPGGLLHEPVSDRNLVIGMRGERAHFRRLDDRGRGREDVAKGGVGSRFQR